MLCENCSIEITKIYGSGRFCGSKCARSFSTKLKRQEINNKVSTKLKNRKYPERKKSGRKLGRPFTKEDRIKAVETNKNKREYSIINDSWDNIKSTYKRERIFREQNNSCLHCKNSIWNNIPITLELDHINGNNKDNRRENLRLLCPNCHAQTPTWRKGTGVRVIDENKVVELANTANSINEILKYFELPWGSNKLIKNILIKHKLDEKFR